MPVASPCPAGRRRTRALVASTLGTAACALLSLTAVARVMSSEISPIEDRSLTPSYVPAPVVPQVAQEPSPQSDPQSASASETESIGFVWVEAPEGTRVFEGERYLGTAPLMASMEPGLHVFRAMHPKTGKAKPAFGNVRPQRVTTVVVDFEAKAPKVEPRRLMLGGVSGEPTNTL